MIPFPPVCARLGWYAKWVKCLYEGYSGEEAFNITNKSLAVSRRNLARYLIRGNDHESLMLSVPVEGGAGVLKGCFPIEEIKLSDHGNWRHVHLKALDAAYGKTPFFIHLMPMLEKVYASTFLSLADFNIAIHQALSSFLLKNISERHLALLFQRKTVLNVRGNEICDNINPDLSIIDALMRLGPETLLALPAVLQTE